MTNPGIFSLIAMAGLLYVFIVRSAGTFAGGLFPLPAAKILAMTLYVAALSAIVYFFVSFLQGYEKAGVN